MAIDISIAEKRIAAKRKLARQKLDTLTSGETETVHRSDTGKTLSSPFGLSVPQIEFLDDTQNNNKESGGFFGFVDTARREIATQSFISLATGSSFTERFIQDVVPSAGRAVSRGAESAAASFPQVVAGAVLEASELVKQELEKPISPLTIAKAFLLTPTGRGAGIKLLDFIGLVDKEKDLKKANRQIQAANNLITSNRKYLKDNKLVRPEGFKGVFFDIGSVFTTIFASIGLSILFRSPKPAAIFFGILAKTKSYVEAREKDFSVDAASDISTVLGIGEGALEFIGNTIFMKAFKNSKPINRIIFRTLEEMVQEGSQQSFEELVKQITGVTEVDVSGGIGRVAYAMALGSIGGASVASIVEVGTSIAKDEGIKITKEDVEALAEKISKVSVAIEQEVTNMINDQTSLIKSDPKAEAETAKIIKDFQEGREIDISNLSKQDQKIINAIIESDKIVIEADKGKIKESRIKDIDKKIDAIDRTIDANKNIDIDKLLSDRKSLEDERSKILRTRTLKGQERVSRTAAETRAAEEIKEEKGTLDPFGFERAEESILGFRRGFREGKSVARKDIKIAQNILIDALKKSGLDLKDRAKFITQIRDITLQNIKKRAPILETRIIRLLERQSKNILSDSARKILKNTKTKKQSGREISKFKDADFSNTAFKDSAQFQTTLDRLRAVTELKLDNGNEVTVDKANELLSDPKSKLTSEEKTLLAITIKSDLVTTEQSVVFLKDLSELINNQRTSGRFGNLKKRLENTKLSEDVADQLISSSEIKLLTLEDNNSIFINAAKITRAVFDFTVRSWDGLRNAAFAHKDVSGEEIVNKTRIFDEIQEEKRIRITTSESYRLEVMEAMGTIKESKYLDRAVDDAQTIDIGEELFNQGKRSDKKYIDAAGDELVWKLSKAQIRQMHMQSRTEKHLEIYKNPEINAFTDEMMDDAFSLLDDVDFRIMDARFKTYEKMSVPHNKVYSNVNGVNLRLGDNYVPLSRQKSSEDIYEFLQDQIERASLSISSQKLRVENKKKIRMTSDEAVMQRHIHEVSHYIATAEKLIQISQIFSNESLRASLETRVGKTTLNLIDRQIQDFVRGRVKEGDQLDQFINKMNANFATSILTLKPKIGVGQLTSIPAYLEFLPVNEFAKGLESYAKNPLAANKILGESSFFLKDRGPNPEKSIAEITRTDKKLKKLLRIPFTEITVENLLSINIRLGDVGAINAGGWTVYRYTAIQNMIKSGMSEKQASEKFDADLKAGTTTQQKYHTPSISKFEEASAKRQQTKDLDQLSTLQRSHSLGRSLSQFASSPILYMGAEVDAVEAVIRGALKKSGKVAGSTILTPREIGKIFALYHFLLPQLFQFVVNGFNFERDTVVRAAFLGSFNAFPLVGQLGSNIVAGLIGLRQYGIDAINFPEAMTEFGRGVVDTIVGGIDTDADKFFKGIKKLSFSIGKLTGKPVQQVFQIGEGINDILSGDATKGGLLIAGWPHQVADTKKEKKKKRVPSP